MKNYFKELRPFSFFWSTTDTKNTPPLLPQKHLKYSPTTPRRSKFGLPQHFLNVWWLWLYIHRVTDCRLFVREVWLQFGWIHWSRSCCNSVYLLKCYVSYLGVTLYNYTSTIETGYWLFENWYLILKTDLYHIEMVLNTLHLNCFARIVIWLINMIYFNFIIFTGIYFISDCQFTRSDI